MNNYAKYNLWAGWLCFAISAVVYLATVEPSASLWDCAEFIATSNKLEVGHPPGAPLFMMIARFFTMFATDVTHVALMMNVMSCLASAFTILFLFWSITHLARKMFGGSEKDLSQGETWAVMGAGLVGALGYAFTDTFWFSAVEAEVYALSSLFTAVVFWAMLQWEKVADEPHSTRWLVLIAYLMGLSIGVHLLNLLAFPAMVFIYYFRKYPTVTRKGVIAATAVSVALIAFVLYFIVPATVSIGAFFDRVFVNSFGLPVNSGLLTYAFLLFALLVAGVWYTYKKGKVLLNTVVLMLAVVILGYASYASVVIRADVNPPMNSNRPDNPYALKSLLDRDQYGDTPLLTGHYYSTYSAYSDVKEKRSYYIGDDGKYHYLSLGTPVYSGEFNFFFPRMHSMRENHAYAYRQWAEIKGRRMMHNGEPVIVPTFGENMRFFFSYQINFMYWRYFLWNFVGRQNDTPSTGSILKGQWLSGITPIDEIYLGPQNDLPQEMKDNKGRNRYFFLPFILGILGIIFQLSRDKKDFTIVMWLFLMTGLAIVVYLNQPPAEPRERDYAYAGSFYAFAIWMGLGVLWVYDQARKGLKKPAVAAVAATAVSLCVPVILIAQNWDDHDRSHRFVASDFGRNYLESALPGAILMNFGDNDTFPQWYSQEVEGTRYDVRIMNLSYLGANWYIDQMQYRYNDSAPVGFTIPRQKYMENPYLNIIDNSTWSGAPLDIKLVIDFLRSEDTRSKYPTGNGRYLDYIPTHTIAIPVDKENAIASGIVKPEDAHLMLDTITITLKGDNIERDEYMLLDLLSTFDWKRPLHFTQPSVLSCVDLTDYLQFDGFTYRLVPIKTEHESTFDMGRIDPDLLYDNLMNKFRYGNIKDPRVYVDYTMTSQFLQTHTREAFARLAKALVERGEREKAIEVLNRCMEEMPLSQLRVSSSTYLTSVIEAWYMAGETATAEKMLMDEVHRVMSYIDYMAAFPDSKIDYLYSDTESKLIDIYFLMLTAQKTGFTEVASELNALLKAYGVLE